MSPAKYYRTQYQTQHEATSPNNEDRFVDIMCQVFRDMKHFDVKPNAWVGNWVRIFDELLLHPETEFFDTYTFHATLLRHYLNPTTSLIRVYKDLGYNLKLS